MVDTAWQSVFCCHTLDCVLFKIGFISCVGLSDQTGTSVCWWLCMPRHFILFYCFIGLFVPLQAEHSHNAHRLFSIRVRRGDAKFGLSLEDGRLCLRLWQPGISEQIWRASTQTPLHTSYTVAIFAASIVITFYVGRTHSACYVHTAMSACPPLTTRLCKLLHICLVAWTPDQQT